MALHEFNLILYMEDPHIEHWEESKRILHTLKIPMRLELNRNMEESILKL